MKRWLMFTILGLALMLALGAAGAQDMMYGEAPMLAALVEAGELPPVEERLPAEPLVITPYDRIGDYGGEWRSAMVGGLDHIWMIRLMAYENLIRFTPDWSGLMPGVAKSFSGNAEATEFIFELREGLRWSDGAPFTADDITFWYDDVLTNEDLTPTIATWLISGGEPLTVEKVDDLHGEVHTSARRMASSCRTWRPSSAADRPVIPATIWSLSISITRKTLMR